MGCRQGLIFILVSFLLSACATYDLQLKDENTQVSYPFDKEILHSFYLIGDAGNSKLGTESDALGLFKKHIKKANKNSTALFLGDNIYPKGLPAKGSEFRNFATHQLNVQTEAVRDFKGNAIFIPGNHDWYSGIKGVKRQEKYIENILGKHSFLPQNGCPIKRIKIGTAIDLIIVDSHWYITNWNKQPTINDDCDIKTRQQFFDEFESLIKKARGKTTLIALHHPIFTNGPHGGQFSFKSHMKPLPILGSLKNVLRNTSGIANVDQIGVRYMELKKRIVTLAQENKKVIFVSGHEHSLEYSTQDNLHQIISGSGANESPTRLRKNGKFSIGRQGFARLDVFKDGSSFVRFYTANDEKLVYQTVVLPEDEIIGGVTYKADFPSQVKASIYTEKEITKSKFHKATWGKRYRKDYGVEVNVPTVNLDTLFGGLSPVRRGGGHQSKSLRLKNNKGQEYVMRAMHKEALQYLQAVAFKEKYIEGQFNNTYPERLLTDVFAGSYPYAPYAIGSLADAIKVFHTNPTLYFVPKQKALGQYNVDYGDELYMIEERAASGHGETASFGFSNELISTYDLLKKLLKNQKHHVDESAYIRARLFDMLIGDWDRHEDQWRWATFKEEDKTIYRPVPRDRDQAFSIMDDGFLLGILTTIIPDIRLLRSYEEELKSVKWFNLEPYPLDVALINSANKKDWDAEVTFIQTHLTKDVIDKAFQAFPKEVDQITVQNIKTKLLGRIKNIQQISDAYYAHINRFSVVKGTNKDDRFEIKRYPNGKTTIKGYRIIKGEKGFMFHERTYSHKETKELWVYGLDDTDYFEVSGKGDHYIPIRLIGGQNKDTYHIKNGKKVHLYDYKSKKSEFITNKGKKKLTDDYDTNVYNYKKLKNSLNQFLPVIGYNPDDGFRVGFSNTFTFYRFERNPFTSQHNISADLYFATQGFDLNYSSEFANVFGNWNFGFSSQFTSPNYSINFFGFGNETINPNVENEKQFDLDYNRVKLSKFKFVPSLIWKGDLGAEFTTSVSFETIEVEQTNGRFINDFYLNNNIENRDSFLGVEADYHFENKNDWVFPSMGMHTNLKLGYKQNIEKSKGFTYLKPILGFTYKLIPSGKLVLATNIGAHINFGNDFEFYQAATIGADNSLRAYRNQRFSGKRSFYQSTDFRWDLTKIKTRLIPLKVGMYSGVDYGKVWVANDENKKWNNSLGGGLFINAADMLIGNVSVFTAKDGERFNFKLGFGF
ncbi:metallophosphoesterase [Aquimarina agarilytica]|uniref:metallophosphoesterase n=1 Tax=Aquimarina agarilytica TaxID=1087449 RepID=UPI00028A04D6|nr:metallophosphoesterase [Aquimarina agarilytica]